MANLPRKISLGDSASWLASLCERIDSGENIDPLLAEFKLAQLANVRGVSGCIVKLNMLEDAAKSARANAAAWTDLARKLEGAHERCENEAIQVIKDNPEIPFKSDLGRLAVQRNSNPKLQLDFPVWDRKFNNTIGFDVLDNYHIPAKYYSIYEAIAVLDADKIKEDLKADEFKFSWAWLDYGNHLKIKKE